MAYIGAGVEYGLHCLLFLVGRTADEAAPSSRDLAELQGVPAEYAAKLFTKLQKAGIVCTTEGARGGLRLGRDPGSISVHDVVIAIDGAAPLFDCREIRSRCAVLTDDKPAWATQGLCGIHRLMRQAEEQMREVLRGVSLADLATSFGRKTSPDFHDQIAAWLDGRARTRGHRGKPEGVNP